MPNSVTLLTTVPYILERQLNFLFSRRCWGERGDVPTELRCKWWSWGKYSGVAKTSLPASKGTRKSQLLHDASDATRERVVGTTSPLKG